MLGAMAQDHERATGPWQSEQLALPQIFVLTSGALMHAEGLAKGLTVDAPRMRGNLDATHGLILSEAIMMALAEKIGRTAAHHAVQHACDAALTQHRPIADILAEDPAVAPHLDRAAIARHTDPANYLGEALAVVDRVVAEARRVFGTA
jgi:3-carboxy-cis,cis-muconate cycloisomerase